MAHYDEQILLKGFIFALLLFTNIAIAQEAADDAIKEAVQSLLHSGDFIGVTQYEMPKFTVVVGVGNDINASAEPESHTIRVTRPLINVMSHGELVFVIAHEIGHLQDADCLARGRRVHLSGAALSRMCEAAADKIAVQYLLAAGYSPFEGAGVMGKLLLANPGENSILGIVVGRFVSDHPVSVDRIKQLAVYTQEACHERPEICQH